MKNQILGFALLLLTAFGVRAEEGTVTLYVGTYTGEQSDGIYVCDFDQESGVMGAPRLAAKQDNPSFVSISADQKYLYAACEVKGTGESAGGYVASYKREDDGSLLFLNRQPSQGKGPCHVSVNADNTFLVASNYGSGSLVVYPITKDGMLSDEPQVIQHEGSGPNSGRQKGPHAHSALFRNDGSLFAADLGIDKLLIYEQNSASGRYEAGKQAFVSIKAGSGPRHFSFNADERFIYVANELSSTLSVLKKNGGEYEEIQSLSTLPDDFNGTNLVADIHLSGDERFVYLSNRGLNAIAVFQRDLENGKLSLIQNEPACGEWPRNFALSPNGKYVLVANQQSNNITVFERNADTGLLTYTGKSYNLFSPVCLKFVKF